MTPGTVDLFSRTMAEMFDQKSIVGVPTTFLPFFTGPMSEIIFSPDSLVVDIDIIRGNEKTAALIPRGMVSRPLGDNQENMEVGKMTSFSRKFPLIEEEGDIDSNQILHRMAGESPYDRMDRYTRMRSFAVKIHLESIRRIGRLFNILAAQSVRLGTQDAILGTTDDDYKYDFQRSGDLDITAAGNWVPAYAGIMDDIDTACDTIRKLSFREPNAMFVGGEVMDAMLNNDTFQALADNRRFELINIASRAAIPSKFQRFIDAGWNPRGHLFTARGYDLYIFTNVDGYTNGAGEYTKYMPDDELLICDVDARADKYFGPPETLPLTAMRRELYRDFLGVDPDAAPMPSRILGSGLIDPGMFYCDAYASPDWKRFTIRTQSAPIFATTETDAYARVTGIIA